MNGHEASQPNGNGVGHAAGKYSGFDHVHFYVSNAKQVADWYCLRFGFERIAYRGLETGSREYATHVVKQNQIVYAFSSPLNPTETKYFKEIMVKGDFAKDVAFTVDNVQGIYDRAVARGAKSVMAPVELKDEKHGSVIMATVQTYGDCVHTFVDRRNYTGPFLPGYEAVDKKDPLASMLPSPGLGFIDHVVGNQPDHEMEGVAQWYEKHLDFHRFWSVDDKQIHTQYSALRSIVVADPDEVVKMPINEPAAGERKSQIQEYVEYHGGPGVQHIAMNTPDILTAIKNLRARGAEFLSIPKKYYTNLRARLAESKVKVQEDLDTIEELNILVDFDDQGYLLQIFSKTVEDRPTLFYEVIQRHNHFGFGAGNFKALFEAIEVEQGKRQNLY